MTWFYCQNNQLTSLDVRNGNNTNFTAFNASGNSNLNCISVDDATWATANWTNIDAHTIFLDDCASYVLLDADFSAVSQTTLCITNPSYIHYQINNPEQGIVIFTDNSTGSVSSWLWDFGDGTTSTNQNPDHIYTAAGTYDVSLTVNGTDTETER